MKKIGIIIGSVLLICALIAACMGYAFLQTPEYALMVMADDIKESGIDGLRPHLTENVLENVDIATAIVENELVRSVLDLLGVENHLEVLKEKLRQTQWDVQEIVKGDDDATVILAFNYDDRLTGTLEISMVHEQDGWKIDGIELPEFD